jgi:hypothetical protein
MFGVAGCVFVVLVVLLPLVLRWPCTLLALEMGLVLWLALVVFFGGRGSLSLGDGWPPGEGMAALCLVNLVGVRGVCWLAAAIAAPFCFFCCGQVPGTIASTWQEEHLSY